MENYPSSRNKLSFSSLLEEFAKPTFYLYNMCFTPKRAEQENDQRKCFTFFSALDKEYRHTKIDLNQIQFVIRWKDYWFPPDLFKMYYVSIHSPNTLPDSKVGKNFVEFDYNADYLSTYSMVSIDRLDPSYDTHCNDYDIDYVHANFNMKSDCIASCYQKTMKEMCNLQGYLVKSPFLLRRQLIEHEDAEILRGCPQEKEDFKVITQCTNQCRSNCKFKYYLFDKKVTRPHGHMISSIFLRHNGMPDLFIRHIPEITSLSFISNFGGLLGMWLGLSILTIFNITFQLIKLFTKFKQYNTMNVDKLFLVQNNFNSYDGISTKQHGKLIRTRKYY